MTAYSEKYFKKNVQRVMEETVQNSAETIITMDSGQAVVMIPLEEYESWKETQYLLSNPVNAKRLLKAVSDIRGGQYGSHEIGELNES